MKYCKFVSYKNNNDNFITIYNYSKVIQTGIDTGGILQTKVVENFHRNKRKKLNGWSNTTCPFIGMVAIINMCVCVYIYIINIE